MLIIEQKNEAARTKLIKIHGCLVIAPLWKKKINIDVLIGRRQCELDLLNYRYLIRGHRNNKHETI